jgi:hypothetical protein
VLASEILRTIRNDAASWNNNRTEQKIISGATMAEWLCCLACNTKVRSSNLGTSRHRMTLNTSLRQAGLLSRATTTNSCRKTIELSKLPPDSTLHRKVAKRRGILLSNPQAVLEFLTFWYPGRCPKLGRLEGTCFLRLMITQII